MTDRTRLVIRAVMTEYMILMAGALVLYALTRIWPDFTPWIAVVGGALVATACVANFIVILRAEERGATRRPR